MARVFDSIHIIYNPKSTNDSKMLAQELAKQIRKSTLYKVRTQATKKSRHAEELAFKIAKAHKRPLIISSSGDGGYHEVINGALRAQKELNTKPTCAVLPAGNANDHSRQVQSDDLISLIKHGQTKKIDVLELRINGQQKAARFAHSYIGLGVTAQAGEDINNYRKNMFSEAVTVVRSFFSFRPVRVEAGSKRWKLSSLTFMNVGTMAKVIKFSKDSKIDDGKFEISAIKSSGWTKLLGSLFKASITGFESGKSHSKFRFKVLENSKLQCDGEVIDVQAGNEIEVYCRKQLLNTLM